MGLPNHLLALLEPGAYPHPVSTIALIETPTSWVLLTGALAYKLKRPIHYPFVDQRSLEHRRALCEAELRLNRRFAPQLYLQTDPISIREGRARVGDATSPVEYAVRMVQFDSAAGLDRLLESGAVAPAHLHRFGEDLAAIHARLPVADAEQEFGKAPAVANWCAPTSMNAWPTHSAWGAPPASRGCASRWSVSSGTSARTCSCATTPGTCASAMATCTRATSCSGPTGWWPSTASNSEAALRWMDVAAEISFLLMDLQVRQAPAHAQAFLAGYLAATGDYLPAASPACTGCISPWCAPILCARGERGK